MRHESRALARLTLPILATQLAQVGMGTVDTIMSGHVSTQDLAAVAIGASVWTPIWLFLAGIMMALSPLASAQHANNKQEELPRLLAAAIHSGIILGIIAAAILWFASSIVLQVIADEKTAYIAANYLRAIAVAMPIAGIFLAYRVYAEALEQPAHVTRIMLTGLLLNIPVNAVFIYGWFGMPELGGIGCGVGSSIIFTGMTIALAWNTRKHRLPKQFKLWQSALKPVKEYVRSIFTIGVPIGVAVFFEVSLFAVIALFLTQLGPTIVAGHQVALSLSALAFMVPLSLSIALTVRVSYWRGKNNAKMAKQTSWLGIKINLALAFVNASIMVLFARQIANLYSPDAVVIDLAVSLLFFAAIYQFSDATQVAAAGALRAYHDTLSVMLITMVAYWLVGLGSGYYLAFYAEEPMGARGFWLGLIIGLSAAAVGLVWRLRFIVRTKAG